MNLQDRLLERKYPVAQIARVSGVSESTIYALRRGCIVAPINRLSVEQSLNKLDADPSLKAVHIGKVQSLTEGKVRLIRGMRQGGMSMTAIAQELGTSKTRVSMIVRGKEWGHVQ